MKESQIKDWYIQKLCRLDDSKIVREIPQPKHNPTLQSRKEGRVV